MGFWYLGTLYTSRSVVVKRELSWEVKLSMYQTIYFPTFTDGHQFWVVIAKNEMWIRASEKSLSVGWREP